MAIIDYGRGNVHSLAKALAHAGARPVLVEDPALLDGYRRAVLPGVGAFGDAMASLHRSGFAEAAAAFAATGRPLLGICLGMQVLLTSGTEGGARRGLGLIPGEVRRLVAPGLKIPHMGWNTVARAASTPALLAGIPDGSYFYFVHSFAAFPAEKTHWGAFTEYGERFASVAGHGAVWGTQFHPEKSGAAGLALLRNFLDLDGGTD